MTNQKNRTINGSAGFDLLKLDQLYDDHANSSQMNREHAAWRQVCKQLALLGVDLNKQDPLACALRLWGEELVELRRQYHAAEHGGREQDASDRALREHRLAYAPHVVQDGKP